MASPFCYFSEFLNLSWMKPDKNARAPGILRVTKRFNEVCVSALETHKGLNCVTCRFRLMLLNIF